MSSWKQLLIELLALLVIGIILAYTFLGEFEK
jgi:hypothetical protein